MKNKTEKAEESKKSQMRELLNTFSNKKALISLGVVLVILLASLWLLKGFFIAATVNGQPISRWEIIQKLEKQGGKNILDVLITDTLLANHAKKKGITITDDEINQEIKSIEATVTKQGATLEQALVQQGMTMDSLRENIKNQKIIEKMLGDKIKVTDAEVNKYITDNEVPVEEGSEAETKKQIIDQLKQQKFQQEAQTLVTNLKTGANIKYYVSY